MTSDERLQFKYKLLVKEVEKRLAYKLEAQLSVDVNETDFSDISPLRIIFPEYLDKPCLKIILSKVYTPFPHKNFDLWVSRCDGSASFRDAQKRMEMASMFLEMHSFRRGNFNAFIFWAMVSLIANGVNFDENLSLVIDFARVFGMSSDEISDIAQVAKAFYGEHEKNYQFKSKEIEALFSGVYLHLLR